jgi:hypothetical protein
VSRAELHIRSARKLPLIFRAPLNLIAPDVTHLKAVSSREESMKIALPAVPSLPPGALDGAGLE